MTGSQRSELVSTILQFVGDTGLRMGAKNHVHWLAETVACIYIIIYTMEIIAVVNVRHDSIKFFEYIKDLSLGGIGIIKLISLRRNHHRWHLLLEKATNIEKDQLEWQSKCENDSKDDSFAFSEYISDYSKKFQLTSKVLSYTYKITLVVYVSSPFLEYGYRKFFGGGTDDLPHILPSCSPLDDYSFAGYVLTILLEFIGLTYCVYVHVAYDLISIGMMIFITGQFIILREYSEKIGGKDIIITKKMDDRAHSQIKTCHDIHIRLKSSTVELRELVQTVLGVYFFIITLTLCSIVVRLNEEIKGLRLIATVLYLLAQLMQLYLFSYHGDNVLNESSINQGQGPYGAAYWSLSPGVRKQLTILAMGMSSPCKLYAGPFISLNLPSFVQVLRTAYSYYALIKNKK